MGRSLEINCPTKSKIAECRLRTERIKTDLLVSSYYGKGADKEVIDLLRWIEESRFLDATIVKMMDTLEGVRSEHHNDKKGRLKRMLFDADLLDSLIKSIGFANSNLLIINKFANYQRLVRLIFETYLLKNDMLDVDNQRIEPNADFFIEHFILAGKPSDFKSIIKKHEILDSPYYKKNEDVIPPFISRMKNLVDNLGFLNDYIGEREDDLTPNYHLKFKINDYVANSIYISTAFDIHADHLNTFYLYLLTFFKKFNFLNFKSAEALSFGINHKLGMLPTTTKKELFSLRDIGSRLLQQNLVVDLFLSDDDFTIQRTAQGAADFDQMINAPGEEQASLCINLFYQIAFLNEKTRKAFADKVVSLLEEKFKVVLAYFAVQEGMMNFTEYLPVFIKHVKVSVDKEFGKRQQYPHRYIEDLNLFLSLLFEHNIDLSRQEIKALNPGSDYYNWLFDMDQFDYSNFDPFWILRFRSDGFIAKYRSSPNLIAAIKNSLKDKYNSAVGEFFVQKIL